jgi:hypothetical protein
MNDAGRLPERPAANPITAADDSRGVGDERGVFDLRLHVTGVDKMDVWRRVIELQSAASLVAPAGVEVRYVQLRAPERSRTFDATMAPAKRKKKRAA